MKLVNTGSLVTKGSTLIVPMVSIGNVPQLTVDLLVNTLEISRLAVLDTATLNAISGPIGYDHIKDSQQNSTAVPLELYQTADQAWTILQQRSPPLHGHRRAFAKELTEFIKQAEFGRVVVLASSDAALRGDAMLSRGGSTQVYSLTVGGGGSEQQRLLDKLQRLSLTDLGCTAESDSSSLDKVLKQQLHSSGAARMLLKMCHDQNVPAVALVSMVNEGDNVPDSVVLANVTNAVFDIAKDAKQWKPPRSWEWLTPSSSTIPLELFG